MWFSLLLLACGEVKDKEPSPEPAPSTSLLQALDDAGFVAQPGAFVFADMQDCCERGAQCYGNNPTTPYGSHVLPRAPGQTVSPPDILASFGPIPDGMDRVFYLRPDEAILTIGPPPPKAAYLGYRAYIADRPTAVQKPLASLGASLNSGAYPVFDQPLRMITSFDAEIEATIQAAVEQAHDIEPDGFWFMDRIAPSVVNPGVDDDADSFMTLMRVALYEDEQAGASFRAQPGYQVYRLTPKTPQATNSPHPEDVLADRGTGRSEKHLQPALDALSRALKFQFFREGFFRDEEVVPYFHETYACIDSDISCAGELRDRWSAISPYFRLDENDFAILYGVNHALLDKATYSSISVQTVPNQVGIASLTSDQMVGSAAPFVDHPDVDSLYVVFAARDCTDLPEPCLTIPADECPGAPYEVDLKVTARAYLEPETLAAPITEELVIDRVMKITRRPEQTGSSNNTSPQDGQP